MGLLCLSCVVFLFFGASCSQKILYEWKTVKYDRDSAIYNSSNCVITGVKMDLNGTLYVTVPRWKTGVPATLCKVQKDGSLTAFPSWDANNQEYGWITYVQSMEIDSRNWMWILDVGRLNILDNSNLIINKQPKLIIYDLSKNCVVRMHNFSDSVLPRNNSFANDLVVDEKNGYAFITDTWANGGLIVYNFNTDTSRRWDHKVS